VTRASERGLFAWALFDWANSAFFAVVQTFVFAAYFTREVAVDQNTGTAQWALALGASGLLVGVGGPVLGAIADQGGRRKPWLFAFSATCIVATASLWFVKPSPAYVPLALVALAIGSAGAQCAAIFYNAMLPALARPERVGRWSGWGWGLGYAGGVVCLGLALLAFVRPERPWLDLDRDSSEHVRATFVLVAAWFLVFALPLLLLTPDEPATGKPWRQIAHAGRRQVWESIRNARRNPTLTRFIVAWMFCADALATLFAFGGVFAAGVFDMTEIEVMKFGIALNVVAGFGAAGFAWVDDKMGGKHTMIVSLIGLIVAGTAMLIARSSSAFWAFGLLLGIFVGPVQAASRSYLSRVTPESNRNEVFGFYALAGKATSFLGPAMVGSITYASGSQRLGMSSVVVLFVVGLALMLGISPDKPASRAATR
jgi:UMF1 family MFS transporter